ncbi:MAG: hypothetical protein AB8F95_08610, partial [Bacteroidia bacterium]
MQLRPTIIWTILALLLALDLGYSLYQHRQMPMHGDLVPLVLPSEHYTQVLEEPFGFAAAIDGERYAGSNRYMIHRSLKLYFDHVPRWLQSIASPVESLYLASALFKTILQLLLCLVIAAYIMAAFRWRDWRYWLAVLCVSAFMQTFGFRGSMGVIDASIVYTFFYAFPLWLLLVFFFPFFQAAIHGQAVWTLKRWQQLTWPLLVVFLAFSGPLVAPLAILVCGSLLAFYLVQKKINLAPYTTFIISLMLGISLYSMYVGSFNLENGEGPSILERFMLMPTGLVKMLFTKIGWPLILILFGLSLFLFVKKGFNKTYPRIWQVILFLLALLGAYLLLLPFGGYRPYRPYIIRYDTFLPGTIIMIMC